MQNINSTTSLKEAIKLLEFEQTIKEQLLKEQFHFTYESLKPINIIKNSLKSIVTSPNLTDNVLGAVMGLATGYLTKKIFIGTSGNIVRKLLGSVLQFGVTKIVTQNPDTMKSIGQFLFQNIFRKKNEKVDEQNE